MIASQDYLDEMKSGASNAIFLVMWPVFNVLLVSSYISKSSHVVISVKHRMVTKNTEGSAFMRRFRFLGGKVFTTDKLD